MLKTDSVPGSIGYLMEKVCPEMSDPSDCETKVGEWWTYLSQIAFNDQMSSYFCYFSDPKCLLFTGDLFLFLQNKKLEFIFRYLKSVRFKKTGSCAILGLIKIIDLSIG